MNCPSDGTTLLMSERQGVEIDYCPQCRGVWLDRGGLDKILERAQAEAEALLASSAPAAAPQQPGYPQQPQVAPDPGYGAPRHDAPRYDAPRYDTPRYDSSYGDRRVDDRHRDPRYKKKKPFDFLGDIFD